MARIPIATMILTILDPNGGKRTKGVMVEAIFREEVLISEEVPSLVQNSNIRGEMGQEGVK